MRQYFRFSDDLMDKLFLQLEIDDNLVTVKAFYQIVPNENYTLITDRNESNILQPHNIDILDDEIQHIISGTVFEDKVADLYFKFTGGSQIIRTFDSVGQPAIFTSTTAYDKGREKNVAFKQHSFNEWGDCALWSFDFNFDGLNWFYPRNILYDSYLNKAPFARQEHMDTFVTAPRLISMNESGSVFSSGDTRKRLLSMFLLDKDDFFTNASFYAKVNYNLGLTTYTDNARHERDWKFCIPLLRNYQELPIPKLEIFGPKELSPDELGRYKIVLYDDEVKILAEDGNTFVYEDDDSMILMEQESIDDFRSNDPQHGFDSVEKGMIADHYIVKKDMTVYLQTNGGYLSRSKIDLVQGIGYFNFRALDLNINEEVKIKVGFKSFSNIGRIKIRIEN